MRVREVVVAAVIVVASSSCKCRRGDEVTKDEVVVVEEIVYSIDTSDAAAGDQAAIEEATRTTLRRRAEALGLSRAHVSGDRGVVILDLGADDARRFPDVRDALVREGRLDFVLAADERDVLRGIDTTANPLPTGVLDDTESLPGVDGVHFVRIRAQPGETLAAACNRFVKWRDALGPLDADVRLLFGFARDPQTGATRRDLARSYLVLAHPEVTDADVADARVAMDANQADAPYVALDFTPQGADRFAAVTAAHVNNRFAIVLDGWVDSAPVIRSAITGGHASITLGSGASVGDAKSLAAVLRWHRLPAKLELLSEHRMPR